MSEPPKEPEPIDGLAKQLARLLAAKKSGRAGDLNAELRATARLIEPRIRPRLAAFVREHLFDAPDQMLDDAGSLLSDLLSKLWKHVDKFPIHSPQASRTPDETATAWLMTMVTNLLKDAAKTPNRRAAFWRRLLG